MVEDWGVLGGDVLCFGFGEQMVVAAPEKGRLEIWEWILRTKETEVPLQ